MNTCLFNAVDNTGKVHIPLIKKTEVGYQLTFFMRGGRPTFYFHSKFRYGEPNWMGDVDLVASDNASVDYAAALIAAEAEQYAHLAHLQLCYMKEYLLHENGVEEAVYCDGTRMIGNFSQQAVEFENHTIDPWGWIVIR